MTKMRATFRARLLKMATRRRVTTVLDVAGAGSIVKGVSVWSEAMAWIAAGGAAIAISVIQAPRRPPAESAQ